MILFHAKRDGTVTTTPNFIPQGSSMQDLVVVSEFDYDYCAIKLLPASGEYIEDVPCTPILQKDFSTIFTAALPPKATVVAGSVDYQLIFTAADGTTQTTLAGSFNVPRGVPVSTPGSVEELAVKTINDLYTIMANTYGLFVGHEGNIYKNTEDIAALKKTVSSAGYVTIPVTEWEDSSPTVATFTLDGFGSGMTAVLIPADSTTQTIARDARLNAHPSTVQVDGDTQRVNIIRANADKVPVMPLRFAYMILKTTDTSVAPTVAILGVDAYGEGGGGAASGVDEEAVKALIGKEVPEWARAKQKPTYTPEEVKARPDTWMPTASDVKADPAGTAESKTAVLRQEVNGKLADYDKSTAVNKKIGDHNVSTTSHEDLRLELKRLADRLNAALNSTDTSLDDLKEIVAYIKSNKTLIDGITSSKVNVTDIVNNLTTNTANVPLSAAQGVALKLLIDSLEEIVEGKVTAEQVANAITAELKDYLTRNELNGAINTALAEAKESGEFDGESVTVASVTESSESEGLNVVKFSDGKTLIVKNGKDGKDGKSAYEIWLAEGNTGTEADFLASLKGDDYILTNADKTEIANEVAELVDIEQAIPDYVIEEADAVAERVASHETPNSFTFAFVTDFHYEVDMVDVDLMQILKNIIGAINRISDKTNLHFTAFGGDNIGSGNGTERAETIASAKGMDKQMRKLTMPYNLVIGNHDNGWLRGQCVTNKELYPMMYKNCERFDCMNFDYDDMGNLYGYADIKAQKIRVFFLNGTDSALDENGDYYYTDTGNDGVTTNDTRTSHLGYQEKQLRFIANSLLDLADKDGWAALFIGHFAPCALPRTVNKVIQAQYNGNLMWKIIRAYKDGTSLTIQPSEAGHMYSEAGDPEKSDDDGWTDSAQNTNFALDNPITVDFSSKGKGEVIAFVQGHHHCNWEWVKDGILVTCSQTAFPYNSYPSKLDANGNEIVLMDSYSGRDYSDFIYNKTLNSAKETAFDIITIDRATKKIYFTQYGAGYDRVVSYGGAEIKTYTVTWVVDGVTTEETYKEGATPSFKGSTDKASDGQYTYTFTGWSPAIALVTGDVTYTAQYSKTKIYKITNNLTNCTNSNSDTTQVTEGSAYNATITANSGYTLDSVSVTMGGSAVSVSGGVISIASVTGNIVITASASKTSTEPSYTNLATPNDVYTGTLNSSDALPMNWVDNARMGSDGTYRPSTNSMVTNAIQVELNTTYYFSGTGMTSAGNGVTSGQQVSFLHTVNGVVCVLGGGTPADTKYGTFTYHDDGTISSIAVGKLGENAPFYMRLVLSSALDKSKIIIAKEPIE
jgi:hypothetical protein